MKKFFLLIVSCISFSNMHAGIAAYSWTAFSWTFGTAYSALSTLHSTFGLYTNKEFQKDNQEADNQMGEWSIKLKAECAQIIEQNKAEAREKTILIKAQLDEVGGKIAVAQGLLKKAEHAQVEGCKDVLTQLKRQQEVLQAQLSKQLQEREEQFKASITKQLEEHKALLSTTSAQLKEEFKELEGTIRKDILDLRTNFGSRWERQHTDFLAGLAARAQKINEIAEKRKEGCKKAGDFSALSKDFMDVIRSQ